ncbi:hypothetical protein Bhyg_06123 [Pseudolycoriella hygida]|uniref:Uncharacterized protein n=1 Tax=Pseudolycoriella hygida TaxID=35572 RepID=A0A9Q0S244_9DIPT|nr:hypothetical protein Bhyg_06123 [Pseudolycoriella hygida]
MVSVATMRNILLLSLMVLLVLTVYIEARSTTKICLEYSLGGPELEDTSDGLRTCFDWCMRYYSERGACSYGLSYNSCECYP